MLLRAKPTWALVALGLSILLASCAPDQVVTPGGGGSQLSADVMGADGAAGPEFYVAPTGSPNADGSFASPWTAL